MPLLELAAPWVFVCSGGGPLGSHLRVSLRFRRETHAFDRAPSAARLHVRFHSRAERSLPPASRLKLRARRRLQEPQACSPTEFRSSSPPAPRSSRTRPESPMRRTALLAPSLGFALPLRGFTSRRPCQRIPRPSSLSVHSVSHALDGLLRHPARGFVSPHNHVQGSALQGLTRMQRRLLVDVALPSRRYPAVAADVAISATSAGPALRA